MKPSKELEAEGEDVAGRAWDMFTILLHAIRGASGGDEVHFAPLSGRRTQEVLQMTEARDPVRRGL